MSADGYVQAAAAQLHSAAQAVKQEADHMRAELSNFESQAKHEIDSKTASMHAYAAEMTATSDPNAANNLRRLMKGLQNDIDRKKNELEQRKSQLQQVIKGKEGAANGLKGQAQGLQSQAGNFK